MSAPRVDPERQLQREALIAIVAIALSLGLLCAVAWWKYGRLVPGGGSKPPRSSRLADLVPEYGKSLRQESEAGRAAERLAAVARRVRASDKPRLRLSGSSSPPSDSPFSNSAMSSLPASNSLSSTSPVDGSPATTLTVSEEPTWQSRAAQVGFESRASAEAESESGGEFVLPGEPLVAPAALAPLPAPPDTEESRAQPKRSAVEEVLPPEQLADAFATAVVEREHEHERESDCPPSAPEIRHPAENHVSAGPRPLLVTPFVEDERELATADNRLAESSQAIVSQTQSGPAPAPPRARQPERKNAIAVSPGDTFYSISRRVYGTPDYYKALYQHNRDRFRRADRLPVGAVIATPPAAELERLYPSLSPPTLD